MLDTLRSIALLFALLHRRRRRSQLKGTIMHSYYALILAPDRSHTVRVDLQAESIAEAREAARRRGLALFRRGFSYIVRCAK